MFLATPAIRLPLRYIWLQRTLGQRSTSPTSSLVPVTARNDTAASAKRPDQQASQIHINGNPVDVGTVRVEEWYKIIQKAPVSSFCLLSSPGNKVTETASCTDQTIRFHYSSCSLPLLESLCTTVTDFRLSQPTPLIGIALTMDSRRPINAMSFDLRLHS